MKHANLYASLTTALIVVAFLLRVSHVSYSEVMLTFCFILKIAFQTWYIFQLEKLVKVTAGKSPLWRRLGSLMVIGAVSLKIMHVQYADTLLIVALLFSLIMSDRHIRMLKAKLAEDEISLSQ